MLESKGRLQDDVLRLLGALRELGRGRYAALFDPKGILLESPADASEGRLRLLVQSGAEALFRVPGALYDPAGSLEDLFEGWEEDEFFLAFVNGRVGALVACPDAQALEDESTPLLKVLADRLLRFNPAWRVDERGRGLFFGSPRLDTVVIGRPNC